MKRGQARATARAQAIAGQALRTWGRHAEARDQLIAAIGVLRVDPDTDTVDAMRQLAALEVFAGSPDADRLSAEALTLGQALDVDAGHLRRTGARDYLAAAVTNLAVADMELGDWDAAEADYTQAVDSDGLADIEYFACYRGWLVALRGDAGMAETMLADLQDLRASEDAQDRALISAVEAFTAAAGHRPQDALRHARAVLAHADALGISSEFLRWAWPLAARAAFELRDTAATAGAAIGEARDIGQRLRCQPLLDRAADMIPASPASPRTPA